MNGGDKVENGDDGCTKLLTSRRKKNDERERKRWVGGARRRPASKVVQVSV
jgi:hypothetical protein